MSADNGVYILETKKQNSEEKEYRVTHASAIDNIMGTDIIYDNITIGDCYKVIIYNDSEVYTLPDVEKKAFEIYKHILNTIGICEYGISIISLEQAFPSHISHEQADKYLANYYRDLTKKK